MKEEENKFKMYLECLIICVNYSDFLSNTLPYNKSLFDNVIIVTDKKDRSTKNLCDFHGIKCLQTDAFYENGHKFNKGRAISEGLKSLTQKGWVIQMDADIYLPPLTRLILEKIEPELDKESIYGIDRFICNSYETWSKWITNPSGLHTNEIYVHTKNFPIGVRVAQYYQSGYVPIGFFQMWHPEKSKISDYPSQHDGAGKSDMDHAKRWRRGKRQLIPEIICVHLDSTLPGDKMGVNWNGRSTPYFGIKDDETITKRPS